MTITAKTQISTLKIYVDNILHLSIPKVKFLSLQSWMERKDLYCIEIYLDGAAILLEYTTMEKWILVLKLLDEHLS